MIKFYSGGGEKAGKQWKKQRRFGRMGFWEKHTNSEGKNLKYEIQEEILYQFLTLLIEILKKWHKYLPRCPIAKKTLDGIIKQLARSL